MKSVSKTKNRVKVGNDEPRWSEARGEDQLIELLNWYSYNKDKVDAQKYFVEYLRQIGENEETITRISECNNLQLKSSVGWLSRIAFVNGDLIPEKYKERLEFEKNTVLKIVAKNTDAKPEEQKTKQATEVNRPSIQQHLENQLLSLFAELAVQVDNFFLNEFKSKFDIYEWLKSQEVKHQHAKSIADYYENVIVAEFREAQSGDCAQLAEAYAFINKQQMKTTIQFFEHWISETRRWADVAKQISLNNRAPRAKKPKPAIKQVAKLNFLKEHENLKSINPTQIIGATQLWVYNTKTRTLGVYVCTNAHGFSVKGSTILNFEASESIAKRLRKPEDVLPKVLEAGKVALRKILPNVRAKEKKLTGRINKDTILLKAV